MKISIRFPSLSLESLLIVFIFIALLLRIFNLSNREFWYDEILSLLLSTGQKIHYHTPGSAPIALANYTALLRLPVESSLGDGLATIKDLLRGIVGGEPHPPLFFLSQHLWMRICGISEASMRSLGVLFSAGAIGAAYGLGQLLMGNRGGLILAALLGLDPFYLFHSLNLRMYCPSVFWVILSAWAMLHFVLGKDAQSRNKQLLWTGLLIGSIAAGLLTFYLFIYFLAALGVLALYLDPKGWRRHGLHLVTGILLALPWLLWGIPQQLRNADLNRFSASSLSWFSALLQHLQDTFSTLSIHLIFGDWGPNLPTAYLVFFGIIAVLLLGIMSSRLIKQGKGSLLIIALILGPFPLLLALGGDIVTGKFTVAWGVGRTVIFALPGNLLLLALCLENAVNHWRRSAVITLLTLYLVLGLGDFSLRGRQMFHTINAYVQQEPETSTLLVMNSQAWGNVLRLAYYIDPEADVDLLATDPADLADCLHHTLIHQPSTYERILWLQATRPVWGEPKAEIEKQQIRQAVEDVLQNQYRLNQAESLSGTMTLDQFDLQLYEPV